MATKLLTPVKRELLATTVGLGKHRSRVLIATLEPGDIISFRAKGTRKTYELPLAHAFRLATLIDETVRYKIAMETYKEKKKAGYRVRKPKRTAVPYSKIFFDATKNDKQ